MTVPEPAQAPEASWKQPEEREMPLLKVEVAPEERLIEPPVIVRPEPDERPPSEPILIPPAKVEVPVLVMLRSPFDKIFPPVIVRPSLDARPPAEIPPANVEVAVLVAIILENSLYPLEVKFLVAREPRNVEVAVVEVALSERKLGVIESTSLNW